MAHRGLVQQLLNRRNPQAIALHQNLFLVVKVVVQRGLGDLQPSPQLAHRRPSIPMLQEQVRRRLQHRITLGIQVALPRLERLPRLARPIRSLVCIQRLGQVATFLRKTH